MGLPNQHGNWQFCACCFISKEQFELAEYESSAVAKADIRELRKVVSRAMDLPLSVLHVKVVLQNAVHHCWVILCSMEGIDRVCRNPAGFEVISFVCKCGLKFWV